MKRKLKIFGIIFIILFMPFVINILNLIIIFSLEDSLEMTNDSIPFIIHLINWTYFIICFLVDYFYQDKREIFSRCLI